MITHLIALGFIDGAGASDAEPVTPGAVTSYGSIEAAFGIHVRPQQRRLPRKLQNELLRQLHAAALADERTKRLIARVQAQVSAAPRRPVDSGAGLARRRWPVRT